MNTLFKTAVADLKATFRNWGEDDASLMAAAVAYYIGLSFFPLLLVLISGIGLFFRFTSSGQDAQQQLLITVRDHFSPTLEQFIADALDQVSDQAAMGGPIGLLTLLFAAIAIFAQFDRAFDRIWNVERKSSSGLIGSIKGVLKERLNAFLMLLGLGTLVVLIFVAGAVLSAIEKYSARWIAIPDWSWKLFEIGVTVSLNALVFAAIYRLIPRVTVHWPEALRGGVLAAVVWEIGRQVLNAYLIGSKYSSAYGVIGSFIAIMLWGYYAISVLFLGAEYVQAVSERRHKSEP